MLRVFVYATLKTRGILDHALGVRHGPAYDAAEIGGYRENYSLRKGTTWPTLERAQGRYIKGDLITVTPDELMRLDAWEDHYLRVPLQTTEGEDVWVYILRPSHLR